MNRKSWLCLWGILVLACLLRIAAAAYWHRAAMLQGTLFRLGDSDSYWTLASQLARGLPYEYGGPEARIFRTPLYPLLLAPWTWISDPQTAVWAARLMGCGLGTLAVGLLAMLARRLGGTAAGLAAAALAAIYPAGIGMSIVILSEAIFLPLMIGYLLCWQSAWRSAHTGRLWCFATAAGALAGAAILARPSWLLFAPFACGLGIVLGRSRWRHLSIFLGTLLGLALVMSPWWFRNARLTGHFVPTTLQVGPSLYDGLHAGASGASDEGMEFMNQLRAEQMQADRRTVGPLDSTFEYRLDRHAQAAAWDWARQHPGQVAWLAVKKFARTWSLWPAGGEVNSTATRGVLTLGSFTILLLAILAQWKVIGRFDWFHGICWLPCIYFTLLHMVFVGSVRYREPALFVLIALAGCAVVRLARLTSWSGPARSRLPRDHASASIPPD